MKRSKHEVARFRRGDRQLNRFEIAHFPDHDDVGIFTKRSPQRPRERIGVKVHFALIHVAASRGDDELDRVFQRDDVVLAISVDLVNEGRQRRRFPARNRSCDEDEAVGVLEQWLDRFRQTEIVHRLQLRADNPKNHVPARALFYDRRAEAARDCFAVDFHLGGVGKVDIAAFFEAIQLAFLEETPRKTFADLSGEHFGVFPDRLEAPESSPVGLAVGGQVDVGAIVLDSEFQVVVDVGKGCYRF